MDFFEVALRLEWLGCALLLWGLDLFWWATGFRAWSAEPQLYLFLPGAIILALALVVTIAAARRFVYWRVDCAGIHQRCVALWNWDLPWSEIASRTLGTARGKHVLLFGLVLPILTGRYQVIKLQTNTGQRRKVNRLAINGDQLDALVRYYLNPSEEKELAERYREIGETAQAKYEAQETYQVPLQFATRESPIVRLSIREREVHLPPVCCNCLGPVAVWAKAGIEVSPQSITNFFRPARVPVPICAVCRTRLVRSWLATLAWAVVAGMPAFLGFFLLLVGCFDPQARPLILVGLILTLPAWAVAWRERHRSSVAKLVRLVRVNGREGWMEMRFGNREYAQLAARLNQQGMR
jgi:hypothetical protein